MKNERLGDFIRDPKMIDELIAPANRMIVVIGGADTGKTTMVEALADFLSRKTVVGLVDLDMGQSHLGPPTTIGWGRAEKGFRGWERIEVEDFYFAGTVTPVGSLLPAVVGAKLITDKALSSCRKVIVDTTGLIAEPAGRVLKQFKIDLLLPNMVLALECSGELGSILETFRFHKQPRIHRLPVPGQAKSKSTPVRSGHRYKKMKAYLKGAEKLEVLLEEIGLRFSGRPLGFSSSLRNRIVSFRDGYNKDVALGVIEEVKVRLKRLVVRSPLRSDAEYTCIVIGRAELDEEDKQVRDVKGET